MNKAKLRQKIIRSLRSQGFRLEHGKLLPPKRLSKDRIRQLHSVAVEHQTKRFRAGLDRYEDELISRIANGVEIDLNAFDPTLVEVHPDSADELLFRYARLHWSIPASAGYGRRLRFLVVDQSNEKLVGIIGLADPVFSLRGRDSWIGWDQKQRKTRLWHVMDAFVLGAVPPYSLLLGGKLVAMLAASEEVRRAFARKYGDSRSMIADRRTDGRLALITTTSALGKSSVYNRLRYGDRLMYEPVGFTQGSGDFHFSNGLYDSISTYAHRWCEPSAKREEWGSGFRNRREVVRKCLIKIGITTDWQYHGIRRQVFVIPLATNTRQFLRGEHERLLWYPQAASQLAEWFRDRWWLPRAERDNRYRTFDRESYRLWHHRGKA
jgi:hypothetical protein